MSQTKGRDSHNRLLEGLSAKTRGRLLAECERVPLERSIEIGQPGRRAEYAYFPLVGFVSQALRMDDGNQLELSMIGDEGMLGSALVLGHSSSFEGWAVQAEGSAWRIGAKALQRHVATEPLMQRMLHRYAYTVMGQLAQAAACAHFHELEPRLAGWLLAIRDRSHSDSFSITHERLAQMLAVRRGGITRAATSLRNHGLIQYHRGMMKIMRARALEDASCGCYRQAKKRYDEAFAA
jgi:CRP-like cAMP-binding protein